MHEAKLIFKESKLISEITPTRRQVNNCEHLIPAQCHKLKLLSRELWTRFELFFLRSASMAGENVQTQTEPARRKHRSVLINFLL
jgi:hypothetical protein